MTWLLPSAVVVGLLIALGVYLAVLRRVSPSIEPTELVATDAPAPHDKKHAAVYELAFGEAIRSIEKQAEALEHVRARSTQILAFATTAGGILITLIVAGPDHTHGSFWWLLVAGAASAMTVVILTFEIVRPRPFTFRQSAIAILRDYGQKEISEAHYLLAWWLEIDHDNNERTIQRLNRYHLRVMIAVVAEIVAWTALAGTTR